MRLQTIIALGWLLLVAAPARPQVDPRLRAPAGFPESRTTVITVWRQEAPAGFGPCVGRVCAGRVSLEEIDRLAAGGSLQSASPPVRYRMRLDRAGALTDLPGARAESGLSGTGVLVAVIDTGLDFTHPDFIDDQGHTRVAWLLDLTRSPEGVHPELEQLGGGAVYSADDLQAVLDGLGGPALGAGRDVIGHGTHVAGIAASDDPVYTGSAPGSRLVVVKAINQDLSGFEEDRVLAALAFADRVAEIEGQPLVVNLSLGNQVGAHDGSEPLELALAELAARPGRAVTVAAGNEAGSQMHARGAVSKGGPALSFTLQVPYQGYETADRAAMLLLDFWYDGEEEVLVRVETPSGHLTEAVGASGPVGLESWTPDGFVELACLEEPHPLNSAYRAMLTLRGEAGEPLTPGLWKVHFRGGARRVDGWIGEFDLPGALAGPRFIDHVDPGDLVGPPATARNVVAVGAYTSRNSWVDLDGHQRSTEELVGELAAYSVMGPTRDGRLKPEVVAPGDSLASTLSSDSDPRSLESIFFHGGSMRNVVEDGRHAVSSGTSMAAPLVAGMAALVFEQNPGLTGSQVRDLLSVTTRHDRHTRGGALYSPSWGFGKPDASRLLGTAGGQAAGGFDPAESLCGASQSWLVADRQSKILIAAVPRDQDGLPLGPGQQVEILASGAEFSDQVIDRSNGIYLRTLLGTGRRGSQVVVSCRANGGSFQSTTRVRLAASYAEADGSGMVGGACSCGGSGSTELFVIISLILIGLRRRRGGVNSHHLRSSVLTVVKPPD